MSTNTQTTETNAEAGHNSTKRHLNPDLSHRLGLTGKSIQDELISAIGLMTSRVQANLTVMSSLFEGDDGPGLDNHDMLNFIYSTLTEVEDIRATLSAYNQQRKEGAE